MNRKASRKKWMNPSRDPSGLMVFDEDEASKFLCGQLVMSTLHFTGGTLILADRLLEAGSITVVDARITAVHSGKVPVPPKAEVIDLQGGYLAPVFCAMSDRARLRQSQTYPMRGGLMEATLFFDALTTEVIANSKHLNRELLLLAHKIKGPDRLALVTDCKKRKPPRRKDGLHAASSRPRSRCSG